jgi:hypothetical protein
MDEFPELPEFLRRRRGDAPPAPVGSVAAPVLGTTITRDWRKPKSLDADGEAAWERMLARERAEKVRLNARLDRLPKKERA